MEDKIIQPKERIEVAAVESIQYDIPSLIYVIRGKQVMLDSDIAALYQVETSALNRSVKRNIKRFPEDFCFQLTLQEYESLRCQIGISNEKGGRRYMPYVFTEQGIAMLSGIMKSDIAIAVNIRIMKTFVEMRKYLANNSLLMEKMNTLEQKQIASQIHMSEFEDRTEKRLAQVFDYISEHEEAEQKIFFEGQIYDAFSLIVSLVQKANKEIILIDGYVDVGTLNLLSKKKGGVSVTIYTLARTRLTERDIDSFNAQYPKLSVKYTGSFHDRFLILDGKTAYHIGASLKDAGKKCFAINHIQDVGIVSDIIQRLELETEE